MSISPDELEMIAAAFAERFLNLSGVDRGWHDDVVEAFRIRPGGSRIRFIFRGKEVGRPFDQTLSGAMNAALDCVDELVEHWHIIRTKHLQPWDAPPGEHRTLGCHCEDREQLEGRAAAEYLSHLKHMRSEGTETSGRASFVCTLIGQRWIYSWGDGRFVLEPFGDPDPRAVLSAAAAAPVERRQTSRSQDAASSDDG